MKISSLVTFLLAITVLFHVAAQQNKFPRTFSSPDSIKIKARIFDSLMQDRSRIMKLPKAIGEFMKIYAFDHPGIGTYIVPLKDVNGDGYNDFAVSTSTDTTFIFFGGPKMDGQPHGFVLGGGAGLLAGDVNGDGYTDIITSQYDLQHIYDPDYRGLVRIYLHNKTGSMYNSQADLQIVGHNPRSFLGYKGYILGGDINGDGKYDLIIWSQDQYGTKNIEVGMLWVYLGKSTPDTTADRVIYEWNKGKLHSYFAGDGKIQVVDINGDGYDDIICISGKEDSLATYNNYGIFLGNPSAAFQPIPDKIFHNIANNTIQSGRIYYLDMNGDECPEIFFDSDQPYPPFVWGKCGQDFLMQQNFIPDAVFTNEEPSMFIYPLFMYTIGHFTGTKYNDYVVGWSVSFQQQIIGGSYFLYQGGPGWLPKGIAYYGIPDGENVAGNPIPLGDITGDGTDDFALKTGWYSPSDTRYYSVIWLFKGDRSLITTSVDETNQISDALHLKIYPNPVFAWDEKIVSIQGESSEIGEVNLTLFDLLGREVKREKRELYQQGAFQFQLDVSNLSSGVYHIIVQSQTKRVVKSLSVINN